MRCVKKHATFRYPSRRCRVTSALSAFGSWTYRDFYLTSAHYTIANEKSITETHSCNTLSFVSMTIITFAARHRCCCKQAMQNDSVSIQRHKGELKLSTMSQKQSVWQFLRSTSLGSVQSKSKAKQKKSVF